MPAESWQSWAASGRVLRRQHGAQEHVLVVESGRVSLGVRGGGMVPQGSENARPKAPTIFFGSWRPPTCNPQRYTRGRRCTLGSIALVLHVIARYGETIVSARTAVAATHGRGLNQSG